MGWSGEKISKQQTKFCRIYSLSPNVVHINIYLFLYLETKWLTNKPTNCAIDLIQQERKTPKGNIATEMFVGLTLWNQLKWYFPVYSWSLHNFCLVWSTQPLPCLPGWITVIARGPVRYIIAEKSRRPTPRLLVEGFSRYLLVVDVPRVTGWANMHRKWEPLWYPSV